MKVGLFFGSFNPIHHGHLIIGNYLLETTDLSEIWFVVSPRNPFKSSKSLLHEFDRIDMVETAIKGNNRFKASDAEFHLPKPSYTITTLTYLNEKYPYHEFVLIMGEDNLHSFPKWRNSRQILQNYELYVYPRPNTEKTKDSDNVKKTKGNEKVKIIDAPLIGISATMIRNFVRNERSIQYLVPDNVADMIAVKKFYI